MPPYPHLQRTRLDLSSLPARLRGLRTLGVPYTDAEIENAVALAQAQADSVAANVASQGGPDRLADREIVAMVAYLQRLGVDYARAHDRADPDLDPQEIEEQESVLADTTTVAVAP